MTEQANPLLSNLRLPGRTFQLPSRGLFYRGGELSPTIKEGEVHVRPMSALDEIDMKNPDQLFNGSALNIVIPKCVDGVLRPLDMLARDVDALILFLRVVTYGPDYDFVVKHGCENAKEHSYTVNVEELIVNMKMLDPTTVERNFTVKLPIGSTVKLAPHRYQHILNMLMMAEGKQQITVDDQKKALSDSLVGLIESVDGVTDKRHIAEWIATVPSLNIGRLVKKIDETNQWGPDLVRECTCKDCGKPFKVDIPIQPGLFFTE